MNIYIVGLNQLFDIAIDKINKPDLPLASGEFTVPFAVLLVGGCGLASVALGLAFGSTPLLYTLVGSGVLGTIYSTDLPLLRWKRHPVLAGGCILVVRGLIVQIGFYSHIQAVIPGIAASWYQSPVILFSMAFITIFSIVIALFKGLFRAAPLQCFLTCHPPPISYPCPRTAPLDLMYPPSLLLPPPPPSLTRHP